jgi:uncharacterized protein (TIGR02145 family)
VQGGALLFLGGKVYEGMFFMKKSFQRVIATLNLFQGKQSLTIFLLAAFFALTACDDSSSAGGDDNNVVLSGDSREESSDSRSNDKDEAISSSGKSNDPAEVTDDSSDSKGNPSSAGTSTKSNNSNTSENDAKSSSSAGKEVSSSSEEMKTAWDYLNPDIDYGEFTDERDGQVYKTVKIGDQVWMAQNLNYAYTGIKFNFSGGKSDSTSWCYKNDLDNCGIYGRLYTWSAAMDSAGLVSDANKIGCGFGVPCIPNNPHRGICPVGWHLPDTTELTVLLNYAGGGIVAQNVLKSKSGWNGTDDLGFSLLPAGTGVYSYLFDHLKQYTEIWSVTEADGDHDERAWILKIDYSDLQRSLFNNKKSYHLSVRCIKDSD